MLMSVAVQIHHDCERKHWVTSSCIDGSVQLCDSVSNGLISDSLKYQLAQIYKGAISDNILMVTIISMQQQVGSIDCGVFSIAAAFSAASGKNLSTVSFEQTEMRSHLEMCFNSGIFSSFPAAKTNYKRCSCKHVAITVHCLCQNIESYDDHMVQCETCHLWYHFKCVGLTKSPPTSWYCPQCEPPSYTSDGSVSPLPPPMPSLEQLKSTMNKDFVDILKKLSASDLFSKFQSILPTLKDISTGKV